MKTILLFLYIIINMCKAYQDFRTIPTKAFSKNTTSTASVLRKTCFLIPEQGPCRSNITMYYFDVEKKRCSTFTWGGCQGNGNRYDRYEDCQAACLSYPGFKFGRPSYCSLSFDYGYCFGAVPRYYYDKIYKTCKLTMYSGCGGNKNNFYSKEKCEDVCRFGNPPITIGTKSVTKEKRIVIINPYDTSTKKHNLPITTTTKKKRKYTNTDWEKYA